MHAHDKWEDCLEWKRFYRAAAWRQIIQIKFPRWNIFIQVLVGKLYIFLFFTYHHSRVMDPGWDDRIWIRHRKKIGSVSEAAEKISDLNSILKHGIEPTHKKKPEANPT